MCQSFEVGTGLRIGEHDVPQGGAVEMSVLSEYGRSKAFDQALKRRLSGLDDVACQLVGIDDRYAEGAEEFRGGRFAAGDASGQPYTEWSATHGARSRPRDEHAGVGGHDLGTEHQHDPAG